MIILSDIFAKMFFPLEFTNILSIMKNSNVANILKEYGFWLANLLHQDRKKYKITGQMLGLEINSDVKGMQLVIPFSSSFSPLHSIWCSLKFSSLTLCLFQWTSLDFPGCQFCAAESHVITYCSFVLELSELTGHFHLDVSHLSQTHYALSYIKFSFFPTVIG